MNLAPWPKQIGVALVLGEERVGPLQVVEAPAHVTVCLPHSLSMDGRWQCDGVGFFDGERLLYRIAMDIPSADDRLVVSIPKGLAWVVD